MNYEHNNGMARRRWLTDLGYAISFRSNGWVECLIRLDNERWFGTGGDEAEAFANALHAVLPSEAARVAFEIVMRGASQLQAATPVAPESTSETTTASTSNALAEQMETLPAIAIDTEGEAPAQPEPVAATPVPDSPTAVATAKSATDELPLAEATAPTPKPIVICSPTTTETEPLEQISFEAAQAELDDLEKAIRENHEEASLLSPARQRLLITQWMARARAIESAGPRDSHLSHRVYAIAQSVGKLSKVWWPGSVQVLAKANSPLSCKRDLDPDLAGDIRSWRDVEAAAADGLDRLEEIAQDQGLDDFGWRDAAALEPAPRNPQSLLEEVRGAIDLRTSPRLLTPGEAQHTEQLKPSLRTEYKNTQIKWAEIAAKARWLRGCTPSIEIWGAAMGRLRWLADHDPLFGEAIQSVIDPEFQPLGDWMRHLGVNKQERRQKRSAVVRRTPQAVATQAEIEAWLKDAFEFGDDLPNERIAQLMSEVADRVQNIAETAFSERKHRRRLKKLQELLRGPVTAPPPNVDHANLAIEADSPQSGAAPEPAPSLESALVAQLRPHTVGRRALFVSNRLDQDRDDKLQSLLGFSAIDPCLHEPARIGSKEQAIGHGTYDFVLAATGFLPHKVDGSLKDACRLAGIPYVRVNRGRPLQCLLHLARELGIDKQIAV